MSEFDIRNTDLKETEKEFERALRPLNFGDFQGQKKIVENLEIFVRAAKMSNLTVVGFYDKYAEHLSTVYFLSPVVSL